MCATVWRQHRSLQLEILVTMELNIQTPMHSHINKTITTSITMHLVIIANVTTLSETLMVKTKFNTTYGRMGGILYTQYIEVARVCDTCGVEPCFQVVLHDVPGVPE